MIAAVIGGAGGLVVASAVALVTGLPMQLAWSGALALLVIDGCVAALASGVWNRLRRQHLSLEPERAVALLSLGKAAALGGAALAGGYLGIGALSVIEAAAVPAARVRLTVAVVSVLCGLAMMGAGLFLERACRVPDGPEDDDEAVDPVV